jgi:peptidoglycan/xylan/chitin deacetylase (PgdA/CDA1 family)
VIIKTLLGRASPAGAGARLSILIFHRVLPAPDPLFPGEIDAARFDAICRWLGTWFRVLPLDEAVHRLARGTLPARAACITFDDGYADNHDQALPILQRHRLPASFFVATSFLGGGRMFNDTVIEAIRRAPGPHLDLSPLGLGGLARFDLRTPAGRSACIGQVLRVVKYLPLPQRTEVVERIASACGRPAMPSDLMMTPEQVRAMHRAGMVIGAHTRTHPILARMDVQGMRDEIEGGKRELEAIVGAPVTLFAYPNGKPDEDYSAASVQVVREAGFDAAVSTAWGAADGRTDRFQLPRFTPWDRSRMRFGLRLVANLTSIASPQVA